MALRCLQSCLKQLPAADLEGRARAGLLPGLLQALRDARVDARKAVVFCLVEMWGRLGDER